MVGSQIKILYWIWGLPYGNPCFIRQLLSVGVLPSQIGNFLLSVK